MSTLESLIAIAPPPVLPAFARGDWAIVERTLGTPLPADFHALIETYGAGSFCDFLHLLAPFQPECAMADRVTTLLEQDRQLRAVAATAVPGALFPEPGGLLPWATTDNGDRLCWRTVGAPDHWPVVVWNPRGGRPDVRDIGAVALLEGWLRGTLRIAVFPRDEVQPDVGPYFERWRQLDHVFIHLGPPTRGGFDDCLAAVQRVLVPTALRGKHREGERGQTRFVATPRRWIVTYDTLYGHQLRVAHPPGDRAAVRTAAVDVAAALGSAITAVEPDDEP